MKNVKENTMGLLVKPLLLRKIKLGQNQVKTTEKGILKPVRLMGNINIFIIKDSLCQRGH